MALKSVHTNVYVPGELHPILQRRATEEGYKSLSSYFVSLAVYDVLVRRPHRVTRTFMEQSLEARDAIIQQIVKDFEAAPNRPGSYFESRLEELVNAELKNRGIAPMGDGSEDSARRD